MDNETINKVTNETSFGSKVGRFIGHLFAARVATCISAVMVALTIRFIVWLF